MNILCRFGFHSWRYHGLPVEKRVCKLCFHRQWFHNKKWSDNK